ncbi:MAG: urea carboxylase [Acidiferrobacterales bacterium]|nr:urea carboxylase [Acidiferrobacterales bacterium]
MARTKLKRVLIANRGAIAVRIIRTLREMNLESVVIYAEADRESLHVRNADHAYSLGDGSASNTYLDQHKIIEIAKQANADAIHPGYGFLSENTEFVELSEKNQIVFLGPTAEQIAAFGLKHRARELAQASGVPLLPGSGILADAEQALEVAEEIGYPIMLKSTAGGGGIGMQLCRHANELREAWDSVSKLSANNFSNADLFIEKFVERARHIEVQVFGDGKGQAIAIGERDCSAQRRNQKVIEETPAPHLSDQARQDLQKVAVALAKSIDYRSAGTIEFIFDADSEDFYFLEVNTRLQVEHGITEEVYGVDIVAWMIELANQADFDLSKLPSMIAKGHSIQARVYAEDPFKNFQPSAGLLSEVIFPQTQAGKLRIDHWIEAGIEVSSFFDPMLAKVIANGSDRANAIINLQTSLSQSSIYGIETNLSYLIALLQHPPIASGKYLTSTLAEFHTSSNRIEVLSGGTMTTIQDYPGRIGYWDIGVPPSGPFDNLSFQIGNQLLNNPKNAAGLEMTMNGAHLRFLSDCQIVLSGAEMEANLNGQAVDFWQVVNVSKGQELQLGKVKNIGARAYLLVSGGIRCPDYLGSKSTFTLGQFGGHAGRALRTGDVLHIDQHQSPPPSKMITKPSALGRENQGVWQIKVIAGPQGAPDFFAQDYIDEFFNCDWEVHYNSSRTGVRLIGPRPIWARTDGGEAGMHPSNIHDNAYAIGAIDFTGDMPVILGPDGPSLGGFVCPATVISADLWKIGQLAAGDKIRFIPVDATHAVSLLKQQNDDILNLKVGSDRYSISTAKHGVISHFEIAGTNITLRQSGDRYLLIEYGEAVLDIELRFMVHRLMLAIQQAYITGVLELTPGIRSLQVQYDCLQIDYNDLVPQVSQLAEKISNDTVTSVPSRIVHLPLSWDDKECQLAIEKYHQSVRKNAPWYPSNIEFIRRINGLQSVDEVKKIVFDANYLVMGLGDVYLGAPVATPIDPRHRMVTTKYNPARTWTAENSVGIGGSYLCIYGMEGPGGYQFVGRTLQMWNRYRQTHDFSKPWLLRFFDQVRFYPVDGEELEQIRKDFPLGKYRVKIEEATFDLAQYKASLQANKDSIEQFNIQRKQAFDIELGDWTRTGQLNFEQITNAAQEKIDDIPQGMRSIDSPVAGNVWQVNVKQGDKVAVGDCILILESMKMEIEINANHAGVVHKVVHQPGAQVSAGTSLTIIDPID